MTSFDKKSADKGTSDIRSSIAGHLRQRFKDSGTTLAEFSQELDIPLTSLKAYLKGSANPRADTIELLAAKLGLSPGEFLSGAPEPWRRAAAVRDAAFELSTWPQERQERLISLFFSLVALFSEGQEPDT